MKGNIRSETPRTDESSQERESFGNLLSRLATASAGLVRDEIDLAKQEMREKVRSLKTGIILIAAAIALGTVALLTLDAALVFAMGRVIGSDLSALIVGVAVAIAAGILAAMGIKRISLKPEVTIRSLREGKEWFKQTAGSGWSAVSRTPPGIGGGSK